MGMDESLLTGESVLTGAQSPGGTGSGGFGSDVIVPLKNGAGNNVNALELITALSIGAPGAETSSWTVKVLQAGAPATAAVFGGLGTLFPRGFYDGVPAHTVCGMAVGDVGTGFSKITTSYDALWSFIDGMGQTIVDGQGPSGSTRLSLAGGSFPQLLLVDGFVGRVLNNAGTLANLLLQGNFSGSQTDVVIGAAGALANNAVGGFLELSTCPGPPTGAVNQTTGKACVVVGNTGATPHLYMNMGAGWVQI